MQNIVIFISANTSGAGGEAAKHKTIQNHNKESEVQPQTFLSCHYKNMAESVLRVNLEETMRVLMKCTGNTMLP